MEQLTIKELAPYLPFSLKIIDGWGDKRTLKYTHLDDEGNGVLFGVKPILRNLSDLTKEIEVDGEKFVPAIRTQLHMFNQHFSLTHNGIILLVNRIHSNTISYSDMQYLISLHFDVFELIERNLAIDLNTIK